MLVDQRVRDELTGDVEICVEANVLQLGKKNNDWKLNMNMNRTCKISGKNELHLLSPKCCMNLQKYLIHHLPLKKYRKYIEVWALWYHDMWKIYCNLL